MTPSTWRDEDVDRLRRDCPPRWRVWRAVRSDGSLGMWMTNPPPARTDLAPTLMAESAAGLRAQMADPGPRFGRPRAPAGRPPVTAPRWRLGQIHAFYSGATWPRASRPHPEAPGQIQEIAAPDRDVLYAALALHDRLDRLRETYGEHWVIGADEVAPRGVVRWVWAAPREHGRPGLRPVATAEELEQLLAARTAPIGEEVAL